MEPNYKETQDELYEGCELLATSMGEEIVPLGNFKAKYNAVFVAAFRGTIATAKNLPDDDQRVAAHEILRIKMVKFTDNKIRESLGSLRLYIRDAYDDVDEREVRLREAGFNDYEQALNYNWEKLKGFLKNANDFITNNLADLTANNNMPVTFPPIISTIKTDLDAAVTNLLNLRENAKQGTQAKIIANNELNKQKNAICEDGQHVFRNDEAKRAQFVWDSIMQIVSPPGKAGLRFDVKEDITNTPIADAEGKFQKEGNPAIITKTDKDGKGFIDSLEPGKYKGTISHPDYVTLSVEFEITTGVTSFKHWLLVKKP